MTPLVQFAGRASAAVHSKKILRDDGPRVASGSVLAILPDGRARLIVPSLGLEVVATLPFPVPVLGHVELRLSVAPGEDDVEATVVSNEKRVKR